MSTTELNDPGNDRTRTLDEAPGAAARHDSGCGRPGETDFDIAGQDIVDIVHEPLLILTPDLRVAVANPAFYSVFRVRPEETLGVPLYELGNGQWNGAELRTLLEQMLPHNSPIKDVQVQHDFPIIGPRTVLLNARKLTRGSGRRECILLAIEDISQREADARSLDAHRTDIYQLTQQLRHAMTETHHRVRNNLQILAALVDMRLMQGEPAIPAAEFERLKRHIQAMAAIHDLLTHRAREDGRAASLSALEALEGLQPLLQPAAGRRALTIHVPDVELPTRIVSSLAIVVSELVSNAIKHGQGPIEVRGSEKDGCMTLDITDGGPGFPESFQLMSAAHTGLELVMNVVRWDLKGWVEFGSALGGGGRVTLRFDVPAA